MGMIESSQIIFSKLCPKAVAGTIFSHPFDPLENLKAIDDIGVVMTRAVNGCRIKPRSCTIPCMNLVK